MGILDEKIVLITGTGGGMGRVAALVFAREGARVVGADINADGNAETVDMVRTAGGLMTGFAPVDLTDPEQVRELVENAVGVYGGLDVVYNNAALQRFGPLPDFSVEDWRTTVAGELDIPFFVSKYAWPHLVARGGGVLINVASEAGMIMRRAAADGGAHGRQRRSDRHDPADGPGGRPARHPCGGRQSGPGAHPGQRPGPRRQPGTA